jgi:uncharacterized protein (TIGR02147 family)
VNEISVFDFNKYTDFLSSYLQVLPKSHGVMRRWAEQLGVHTTLISQVMNSHRHLSPEQGLELSKYLGLPQIAREYFIELILYERAGTEALKNYHQTRLQQIQEKQKKLSERLTQETKLSDQDSAIFYSSWIYSAIRLSCSIKDGKSLDELVQMIDLPRDKILSVLEFLVSSSLLRFESGFYKIGTQSTHLLKDSVYLSRHLLNWRSRALLKIDAVNDNEFMYSAPFSISHPDFEKLRAELLTFVENFLKTVKNSDPEVVACFNLDLFKITK